MNIVDAYQRTGSYRGAAAVCGVNHKTVRRVVERAGQGRFERRPASRRTHNTDMVAPLIEERVRQTDGRISAKRLLPAARAAGYAGSARNLRRAVAEAKAAWRRRRRVYRPWVHEPGEHLVIDWGSRDGLEVFCCVLAWSRTRFVRFARDQRRTTTLRLLAECFETLGGVPAVVLADRMACLRATTVAGLVVPHPEYLRFAAHYGFRCDFCAPDDPESKGIVENLVGYAESDLLGGLGPFADLGEANAAAARWCAEVNGRPHAETCAVPAERLTVEQELLRPLPSLRPALAAGVSRKVDRLACVRFGSARYSVPAELVGHAVRVLVEEGDLVVFAGGAEVARHRLVAPGAVALRDEHYGGPRRAPVRSPRARSAAEKAFLALGPEAEAFLVAAAAAGTPRLAAEIAEIDELACAWGPEALRRALTRALTFRCFRAADLASILAAGEGVPAAVGPGAPLAVGLPAVPVRPLTDYALAGER
ncbi:MAG TPA: IS21 family transposase [Thermoleophilia bacterium]|nr:IS21 family transposase [Thermoleophilia bacterium]